MKEEIKDKIYIVRGQQVMLDVDLAGIYEVSNGTKALNLAVRRNVERFPEDFCFQLTIEETEYIFGKRSRFQIETLNKMPIKRGQNIKYLPYVFTEQGIAMLSSVLKTERAVEASINLMRAFVEMRKHSKIYEKLVEIEFKTLTHDRKIDEIFDLMQKEEITPKIFFSGQVYDSYSLLIDIIKSAAKEIVIIDNYIDKSILDVLTNKRSSVNVTIFMKNIFLLRKPDIDKFNIQYPKLEIKSLDNYHDRFIIVDSKYLYHIGASLKDLGKKTFAINVINDKKILDNIAEDLSVKH